MNVTAATVERLLLTLPEGKARAAVGLPKIATPLKKSAPGSSRGVARREDKTPPPTAGSSKRAASPPRPSPAKKVKLVIGAEPSTAMRKAAEMAYWKGAAAAANRLAEERLQTVRQYLHTMEGYRQELGPARTGLREAKEELEASRAETARLQLELGKVQRDVAELRQYAGGLEREVAEARAAFEAEREASVVAMQGPPTREMEVLTRDNDGKWSRGFYVNITKVFLLVLLRSLCKMRGRVRALESTFFVAQEVAHEIRRRGYDEALADRVEAIRGSINMAMLGVPREEDAADLREYGADYEFGDAEAEEELRKKMERRKRSEEKGKGVDRG
jgi:hypothetical protein